MSYFIAIYNALNSILVGAPPQTPAGEHRALPQREKELEGKRKRKENEVGKKARPQFTFLTTPLIT